MKKRGMTRMKRLGKWHIFKQFLDCWVYVLNRRMTGYIAITKNAVSFVQIESFNPEILRHLPVTFTLIKEKGFFKLYREIVCEIKEVLYPDVNIQKEMVVAPSPKVIPRSTNVLSNQIKLEKTISSHELLEYIKLMRIPIQMNEESVLNNVYGKVLEFGKTLNTNDELRIFEEALFCLRDHSIISIVDQVIKVNEYICESDKIFYKINTIMKK
jgi:hypothetical protein